MKDELAGQLIDGLMTWTAEEQAEWMRDLRRLAVHKFDHYEQFGPGERFFESLARWLSQFEDHPDDRRLLLQFVLRDLVFVSRDELDHAIACVYPDYVKRRLIELVAGSEGLPWYRVKSIVGSDAFRTLRRKTLYLGLSDGARIDRLRRSNPELSHEQFWLAPELGKHAAETMSRKLAEAIESQGLDGPPLFRHIVLLDDFYGSGTSLLRRAESGEWQGKLARAREHIESDLRSHPLLEDGFGVSVVIYVASAQATDHIREHLEEYAPDWRLDIVLPLPTDLPVEHERVRELCVWFFDSVLVDVHKKGPVPLGYMEAALPVILHHNSPNNSISLLWADSTGREGGADRHALFPRYERHHEDRP